MGGSVPSSVAADWLTTAWDQNSWLFATSPAAAVCEEIAGEWLKELLGLPKESSYALVTGCQMAHTTCLAAARHRVLARQGWDVEERGLCGGPAVRMLAPADRHGSVDRSLQLLGIGRGNLVPVEGDWEAALARERGRPLIVVLQAGELNTGRFDDFARLIPMAKEHGAWVHIDGAFGLWARASERFAAFTRGLEEADSWTTDGHKWLNVPFDCGYAFVRDSEAHCAALSHITPYQVRVEGAREPLDWTPEWSRRARGFATYAAIRELGREGIASVVERCCDAVAAIVAGVRTTPGVEVLAEPVLNQALIAFGGDARTDAVITRVCEGGSAMFGGTMFAGRRAMRISLVNWSTSEQDVREVIGAIRRAAAD
jgi:glutamate/tyrosine decarboxylase-like PLP-dependent enzyme